MRLIDGKITVESKAENGIAVDADRSIASVADAAINKKGTAEVFTQVAKPDYGDVKASDIKLPDTLASSSTYYGESSDARRKNVEQAANLENGWLVAPGDTFSFVEHVGGVSEKEGFVVGFGIVDNGEGGVNDGAGHRRWSLPDVDHDFPGGILVGTADRRAVHPPILDQYLRTTSDRIPRTRRDDQR